MSQSSITGAENPSQVPGLSFLKVAKYTINAGQRLNDHPVFRRGSTNTLEGPALGIGDLILNVVTDTTEAFADADAGNDTTVQVRFNDGATQTDIQAAGSIGSAPFSSVRQDLMVMDFATEGDWLKLTLPTRMEVIVSSDVDITAGIMDIYVCFVSVGG